MSYFQTGARPGYDAEARVDLSAVPAPVIDQRAGGSSQSANDSDLAQEVSTDETPARRSSATLLSSPESAAVSPADWGWRAGLRKMTGGLVSLAPTDDELTYRAAEAAVRQPFSRPMTVVAVNPKGGAGKTPAVLQAAATFGTLRGSGVVAWDNNETQGTLGLRALPGSWPTTVWDLLADLERFEGADARLPDLGRYLRPQGDAHFQVLASAESLHAMSQIGSSEYERINRVLDRWFTLKVIDTGNNMLAANWQAAMESADVLLICSTYRDDVAYTASTMLERLEGRGYADLVARSVTVLSAAEPGVPANRTKLIEHFSERTRAVAEIPFDAALAAGSHIQYGQLQLQTRRSWVRACAAVAASLADLDQQEQGEET